MPRPFTDQERALLVRLVEGAGSPPTLLAQLAAAEFGEPWFAGSQSFSIILSPETPRYLGGDRMEGGRAIVGDASVYRDGVVVDDNYVGGLMLWSVNGLLSSLEYHWVTDEMPTSLPPITDIVE